MCPAPNLKIWIEAQIYICTLDHVDMIVTSTVITI
jgi:hypothetical protein